MQSGNSIKTTKQAPKMDFVTIAIAISTIAVVGLHTNGVFWIFSRDRYWITANFLECLLYFAVPVFFMVTGATLIDFRKRYTLREYFSKRFHKTVIPFMFWSIMGLVSNLLIHRGYKFTFNVANVWNGIVTTKFVAIFWFFIPLFCIYLCLPLFSAVSDQYKLSVFKYIISITFVFNCFIPFLIKVLKLPLDFTLNVMVGHNYLIYVLLGYVLTKDHVEKKTRKYIYALSIFGLLLHCVGTYYVSIPAGKIIETYKGYLNVPCILYSAGIFLVIQDLTPWIMKKKYLKTILLKVSKYSFSIYLLQYFFLQLATEVLRINQFSIIYRLGGILIIVFLCIACAYIIRKLPVIKHILP